MFKLTVFVIFGLVLVQFIEGYALNKVKRDVTHSHEDEDDSENVPKLAKRHNSFRGPPYPLSKPIGYGYPHDFAGGCPDCGLKGHLPRGGHQGNHRHDYPGDPNNRQYGGRPHGYGHGHGHGYGQGHGNGYGHGYGHGHGHGYGHGHGHGYGHGQEHGHGHGYQYGPPRRPGNHHGHGSHHGYGCDSNEDTSNEDLNSTTKPISIITNNPSTSTSSSLPPTTTTSTEIPLIDIRFGAE